MASPLAASKMLPMMAAGDLRGEDDGGLLGLDLARAEALAGCGGGFAADVFGGFEFAGGAGVREPVVALHGAVRVMGDGGDGEAAVAAAVLADEAAGVDDDLVGRGGVEVAAAGVLDARIVGHGGGLGATGDLDALGGRLFADVVEVEAEVCFELAERWSGSPAKGSSLVMRASVMAPETSVSIASGERSEEEVLAARWPTKDAEADGAGARFFEGLDLAEADECGELVALVDDCLGVGCAGLEGFANDIGGKLLEIGAGYRRAVEDFSWHRRSQ